jgi:hypothetical protein
MQPLRLRGNPSRPARWPHTLGGVDSKDSNLE